MAQGAQQFTIRGIGLLRSADDIGRIVVASRNTTPILVRDVAHVSIGAVPRLGIVGQDEDDDVVTGIVIMRKGENPSMVLKAVKEKIDALNERGLPRGVQIVPFYDRTWLIDTTLHTVFKNLAEGAMLVTFVLLLFLGNLRAAFIVALMTEQLAPRAEDKVLEIGTGSGYQAAVLAGLVKEVFSIEIVEPLARRAAAVSG